MKKEPHIHIHSFPSSHDLTGFLEIELLWQRSPVRMDIEIPVASPINESSRRDAIATYRPHIEAFAKALRTALDNPEGVSADRPYL
ncbi:MAG TPA: hypothetical protein VMS71_00315 [Candidatus Acidoferrum sp.]|jgi:hypothetical protein|nr:hypothetical protein [Candidatus Acidoferrum sp.]